MSNPEDIEQLRWWLGYLATLGVTVTTDGEQLNAKAPPGVLTEGRLRDLKFYRSEILEIITAE